jgi:hypothetical protein
VRLHLAVLGIFVAVIASLAVRYRWGWAMPVTRRWERLRPFVAAYVRCAPATFIYLFVLTITTWVLRSSPVDLRHALLSEHSTNIDHLKADPISVLVTSAFWVTGPELLAWVVLFPLVLAPAERWLGTLRTIVVFAIGHIGATVITAGAIAYMIHHGYLSRHLRDVIDVGSSYGFLCVAAVFTYRLPGWWRWVWAAALVASTAVLVAVDQGFADYGHLAAVLIGLALYTLTTARVVRNRDHWPIWRPPHVMVVAERERIEAHSQVIRGLEQP